MARKGIYCLESYWFGHRDRTSIEPILQLLQTMRGLRVPYLHYKTSTREEFDFHLAKWKHKAYHKYSVLYLGFHGESEKIILGGRNSSVTLDELATKLEASCKGRIIHFGSCSTLDVHGNSLNSFLRKTEALAVCGYRTDVDWLESAAFDLLLLGMLQDVSDTRASIEKAKRLLEQSVPGLQQKLQFRIEVLPKRQ